MSQNVFVITNRKLASNVIGLRNNSVINDSTDNETKIISVNDKVAIYRVEYHENYNYKNKDEELGNVDLHLIPDLKEKVEEIVQSGQEQKNWIAFLHGNDQKLYKNIRKCKIIADKYDKNVIVFSWPSWEAPDKDDEFRTITDHLIGISRAFTPNALEFSKFLDIKREQYHDARVNAIKSINHLSQFFDHLKELNFIDMGDFNKEFRMSFLVHSLGHYILREHIQDSNYPNRLPFFDNIILHQGDEFNNQHHEWVTKLQDNCNEIYVTYNEHDAVLELSDMIHEQNASLPRGILLGRFKNDRLGNSRRYKWKNGVAGVNYLDLSTYVPIGEHGPCFSYDETKDIFEPLLNHEKLSENILKKYDRSHSFQRPYNRVRVLLRSIFKKLKKDDDSSTNSESRPVLDNNNRNIIDFVFNAVEANNTIHENTGPIHEVGTNEIYIRSEKTCNYCRGDLYEKIEEIIDNEINLNWKESYIDESGNQKLLRTKQ